jgi:hypothetical protein
VAYLQSLTARSAGDPADAARETQPTAPARKASASIGQPTYQLGGPAPPPR